MPNLSKKMSKKLLNLEKFEFLVYLFYLKQLINGNILLALRKLLKLMKNC